MISTKLTLAGVLVAMFLLSFDSVESDCNCEGPVVNYCCPTSFNGQCCEYPVQRSEKRLDEHSPLALKLKKEAQAAKKDVPESRANKRKPRCKPKRASCSNHVQCCSRRCCNIKPFADLKQCQIGRPRKC